MNITHGHFKDGVEITLVQSMIAHTIKLQLRTFVAGLAALGLVAVSLWTPEAASALTDLRSRDEIALGFTDNATYADSAKRSDLYFKISSLNRARLDSHQLALKLGLTKYFKEGTADLFSWRLSDKIENAESQWKYLGSLYGQHYPSGVLGTTDSSFDYFGLDLGLERTVSLSESTEVTYGVGNRLKRFTNMDGRTDDSPYLALQVDREINADFTIGASGELGFAISSLSDFSQTYFEIGGSTDWSFTNSWSWANDLLLRESYFTSRTVSQQTVITRRRGRTSIVNLAEHEQYTGIYFTSEVVQELSESSLLGFSFSNSIQSSRSGFQDYAALDLFVRAQMTF